MNIVIFSNAPIKKITEALNLPFSPKEGWVSAAIAMLQTVECNIFYVFPQRKTKEVIKGKIDNIQYYGYPKTKRYDWEFEESHQRIFEEILKDIPQINVIHIMLSMVEVTLNLKFIILLAFVGLAWEKEKVQDNNDEW